MKGKRERDTPAGRCVCVLMMSSISRLQCEALRAWCHSQRRVPASYSPLSPAHRREI